MPSGSSNNKARRKKAVNPDMGVDRGTGNVFADLGLPNPELALAKAQLVQHIRDLISCQKLSQAKVAERLGLDQPKVSALIRGQVEGYTYDRLFRILHALGQSIEIHVRPRDPKSESRAVVVS